MGPFRAGLELWDRRGQGIQSTQEKRTRRGAQKVAIIIAFLPEQLKVNAAFVFSRQKVVNAYKKCINTKQCCRHPNVLGFSLPQTIATICISLKAPGNVMDTQEGG